VESQPKDVPGEPEAGTHRVVTSEQPVLDLGELSGTIGDSSAQREQSREQVRALRRSAAQAAVDRSGAAPGAHYFGWLYLAAWALGTFPLFADPDHRLWFVPWIVMLGYGLLGHAKAEQTGTMFEFADSVYYLGFTLSVGALLASLDPFNPNAKPDAERLFRLFGLALITTLFGVVGRTALQTFYRLPSETIEEVNQRLTAEARRYVDRLSELTASMDRILTTQVQTTEAKLVPQFVTMENALRMTVADLTLVAGGAQALKETVKDATAALGAMTEQYQARGRDMTSAHDSLVTSLETFAQQLDGLSDATANQRKLTEGELEVLQQQVMTTLAAARDVSAALEEITTLVLARLQQLTAATHG
jgi:hypothetical protein